MDLKTVGTLLYWCEGSKRERDRRIEFVNSDPAMISIFMRYLRARGVEEGRIRARLTIHQQDSDQECRNFWKEVTSLNESNFLPTTVRVASLAKKPLPHGTIAIRYNSVQLLRQVKSDIQKLVEGIQA
jgi:hypothetical protein